MAAVFNSRLKSKNPSTPGNNIDETATNATAQKAGPAKATNELGADATSSREGNPTTCFSRTSRAFSARSTAPA